MRYLGSKLKEFVRTHRGAYTDICVAMLGGKKKGLDNYYVDGRNIQINKLTALLKATGKSLDFFVEFDEGEMPKASVVGHSLGNNNIINSMVKNDLTSEITHLHEVIKLKDQLLNEKDQVINLRTNEVELWKKKYDDLINLANSK